MRRHRTSHARSDLGGDVLFAVVGIVIVAIAAIPTLFILGWQRYRRAKAQSQAPAAPLEE